jgi:hypothetical protein
VRIRATHIVACEADTPIGRVRYGSSAQAMQAKIDGELERAILSLVLVAHISPQSPSI